MSSAWNATKRLGRTMYSYARGIPTDPKTQISRELIAESKYGHIPTIRRILASPNVNLMMKNAGGKTALMNAARDGHIEIVQSLLDKFATLFILNAQDIRGNTALMKAARNGHTAIVKLLLMYGANLLIQSKDGMSALMYAVVNSHVDIVNELIRCAARRGGMDMNSPNELPQLLHQENNKGMSPILLSLSIPSDKQKQIRQLMIDTGYTNLGPVREPSPCYTKIYVDDTKNRQAALNKEREHQERLRAKKQAEAEAWQRMEEKNRQEREREENERNRPAQEEKYRQVIKNLKRIAEETSEFESINEKEAERYGLRRAVAKAELKRLTDAPNKIIKNMYKNVTRQYNRTMKRNYKQIEQQAKQNIETANRIRFTIRNTLKQYNSD